MSAQYCLIAESEGLGATVAQQLGGMAHLHVETPAGLAGAGRPVLPWARVDAVLVEWAAEMPMLLQQLRGYGRAPAVPLFVLTHGTEAEHVTALMLGADGVLALPMSTALLQARIMAYRRSIDAATASVSESPGGARGSEVTGGGEAAYGECFRIGALEIDVAARLACVAGRPLTLTAREFDLLAWLVQHQGRCLRRDDILAEVWGIDYDTNTNILDVHVCSLRRKLRAGRVTGLIQTVRGVGYRAVPPSRLVVQRDAPS